MNVREDDDRSPSDERLLADFLGGDSAGYAGLVERYADELYRFVARFVRAGAAAEDVVQETFIQVYQSAAGFDTARRFRPWLFTIAANKARDHLRDRGRKREVALSGGRDGAENSVSYLDFLADEFSSPPDEVIEDETREIVRDIVSRMPDHLREVLVLGYYQRLPYKEIAEILAVPLGTVKSRLHAAVAHFATSYKRASEGSAAAAEAVRKDRRSDERPHAGRSQRS